MTERAYTVQEIDALRRVVENDELWGRYSGPIDTSVTTTNPDGSWQTVSTGCSRAYKPHELAMTVQYRVRTYMLAGLTAADLLESER